LSWKEFKADLIGELLIEVFEDRTLLTEEETFLLLEGSKLVSNGAMKNC